MTDREALRRNPLLASFTDNDLAFLQRLLVFRDHAPGAVLLGEGDATRSMNAALYILLEGEVEVFSRKPEGGFGVAKTVGAGAILGMIGLLDQGPRSATCRALTQVRAAELSRRAFLEMYRSKVDLAANFRFALARQLVLDIRNLDAMLRAALLDGDHDALAERFAR